MFLSIGTTLTTIFLNAVIVNNNIVGPGVYHCWRRDYGPVYFGPTRDFAIANGYVFGRRFLHWSGYGAQVLTVWGSWSQLFRCKVVFLFESLRGVMWSELADAINIMNPNLIELPWRRRNIWGWGGANLDKAAVLCSVQSASFFWWSTCVDLGAGIWALNSFVRLQAWALSQ